MGGGSYNFSFKLGALVNQGSGIRNCVGTTGISHVLLGRESVQDQ